MQTIFEEYGLAALYMVSGVILVMVFGELLSALSAF